MRAKKHENGNLASFILLGMVIWYIRRRFFDLGDVALKMEFCEQLLVQGEFFYLKMIGKVFGE